MLWKIFLTLSVAAFLIRELLVYRQDHHYRIWYNTLGNEGWRSLKKSQRLADLADYSATIGAAMVILFIFAAIWE